MNRLSLWWYLDCHETVAACFYVLVAAMAVALILACLAVARWAWLAGKRERRNYGVN